MNVQRMDNSRPVINQTSPSAGRVMGNAHQSQVLRSGNGQFAVAPQYHARNMVVSQTASPKLNYLEAPKGNLFSRAKVLGQECLNSSKNAAQVAAQDRASGKPITEGLRDLQAQEKINTFLELFDRIQAQGSTHSRDGVGGVTSANLHGGLEGPSLVDEIGSYGQNYLINNVKQEAISYLMHSLGVETSQFSLAQGLGSVVDSVAGTSTSVVGGSTGVVAGEAATGAGAAIGEVGAVAGQVVGAVGAAYSAYQMIDNWGHSTPQGGAIQGASMGAYVGSFFTPIGTAVGAVIGAALGAVAGSISSGKHKDQYARDAVRDHFQEIGLVDDDYGLQLADGTTYDIGKDGGHRYPNLDGTQRAAYQIDFSNPDSHEAIGWAQPIATVLTGGDQKLACDYTGYFVNAVLSNASDLGVARENMMAIFEKSGVAPDEALAVLTGLYQEGKLDEGRFVAYSSGLATLLEGRMSTGESVIAREISQAA